ncbi:hypothetical protein G6F46_014514 [Rhizopus delemar]|nr:hypothetical protein G6F46_014514 [Rhizopus delemar]
MLRQPAGQALHDLLLVAGIGGDLQPGRCAAAGQQQQRKDAGQALGQAPAPDSQDALRAGGIGLNLGAQPVDVRVHSVLVAFVLVAPHMVQQIHPGKDLVGMAGKEMQQVELARRQVQSALVDVHGS